MSDSTSQRVLRSVSNNNKNSEIVAHEQRIAELENFILSLNLDSSVIASLNIKQDLPKRRTKKTDITINQTNHLSADHQSSPTIRSSSTTKRLAKSDMTRNATPSLREDTDLVVSDVADSKVDKGRKLTKKGGKQSKDAPSLMISDNVANNENESTPNPTDSSAEELVANVTKPATKRLRTITPNRTPSGLEEASEVEAMMSMTELEQPLGKQPRKIPDSLAARLARTSAVTARKGLTVNTQKPSSVVSKPSLERGPKETLPSRRPSVTRSRSVECKASVALPPKSAVKKLRPKFNWKAASQDVGGSSPSVCVFIAHDNPQLSKTIMTRLTSTPVGDLATEGLAPEAGASQAAANKMQIMLESKGKGDATHFLIGDIIYSGDHSRVEEVAATGCRGSEWLIVTNLRAVRHSVKELTSRAKDSSSGVVEVNLVDLPLSSQVNVSSRESLAEFLADCQARVDCILDPYHTDNIWYPYFEASEGGGNRKMAPQFRSQGIGYIRLGDEMSNFGIAFISLDAGATYLDNGATSIENNATSTQNTKTVNFSAKFVATPAKVRGVRRSLSASEEALEGLLPTTPSRKNALAAGAARRTTIGTKPTAMDRVLDIVASLRDSSVKFSERTESLNALQALLSDINLKATSSSAGLEAFVAKNAESIEVVLGLLLEYITKQKHPLVVAATLQCIGTLTYGELLSCQFGVAWRSLVLETMHMLRNNNKQISETVLSTLNGLHKAKSVSFGYLSGLMADILSGPHSAISSSGSGGSNISKVVGWLDSAAKTDLDCHAKECAVQRPDAVQVESSVALRSANRVVFIDLLRKVSPFLSHREEVTRENAISLSATCTTTVALIDRFSAPEFAVLGQELASAGATLSALLGDVELVEVLDGIQKSASRSYEKVASGIAQTVQRTSVNIAAYSVAAALLPEGVKSKSGNSGPNSGTCTPRAVALSSEEISGVEAPQTPPTKIQIASSEETTSAMEIAENQVL